MALVLIPGPDNAPSTTADWDKINNVLQTIGLDTSSPLRISGSNILRGSVIFFAGAWYVADTDTTITGSATDYVRLTNSAGTVTAAFVSSLSGVSFNRTWNGWYDSSMRLYLFDEIKAYAAGAVTDPVTIKNYRPSLNWAKAWSRILSAAQLSRLFRLSSEVVLTGSGTWTVPAGVYWIEGEIIAPGTAGKSGNSGNQGGGNGGDAGRRQYFGQAVTPGNEIFYACTYASTIFGSTTLLAGGGDVGGMRSQHFGGSGGGIGGRGGAAGLDGEPGKATEGGGGGGGGPSLPGNPLSYGSGGTGGMGSVRIR